MGIFLDVLPACRKNCPGPIKQGHLHLQVIPVNELDYLVNPLPSDTSHSGLVGPDPKCLMHAIILMWDGDVFPSLARSQNTMADGSVSTAVQSLSGVGTIGT
ncbi:hypothetical protein Peur_003882 [Populus x canadensis]